MLSILCVRLTIKVKVGIPESFKTGWYPPPPQKKITGSSHLNSMYKVRLIKSSASEPGLSGNNACDINPSANGFLLYYFNFVCCRHF